MSENINDYDVYRDYCKPFLITSEDIPNLSEEDLILNNIMAYVCHLKFMFDYSTDFPQMLASCKEEGVFDMMEYKRIKSVRMIDQSIDINCNKIVDIISNFDRKDVSDRSSNIAFRNLSIDVLKNYYSLRKNGFFKFVDDIKFEEMQLSPILHLILTSRKFMDAMVEQYLELVDPEENHKKDTKDNNPSED